MTKEILIDFLRNEKIEHLFIYSNDKLVFHEKGDVNLVTVLNTDLFNAVDNELIHNHPSSFPFSISDVTNTVRFNAKCLTLVTYSFIYTLLRPVNGWNIDIGSLEKEFSKYDSWANDEIDKLIFKNLISLEEAHHEKNHYIWLVIFNKYGVKYSRKSTQNGL